MKINVCKEVSVETAAKLLGMTGERLRMRIRDGMYGRAIKRNGRSQLMYIITVGTLARDLAVPADEVCRRVDEIESQV